VKGLTWTQFPQDGLWGPVWHGVVQATLFTSGNNTGHKGSSKYGRAATAFAVAPGKPGRIAIIMNSLNRAATDGTTGGLNISGPKTALPNGLHKGKPVLAVPRSAAFSPDGKWVYLTGYRSGGKYSWMNCVMKLDYAGNTPPELFVGSLKQGDAGTENNKFKVPLSVSVDAKGRVYVADYMNDRIQVFTPDGKHFKTDQNVRQTVTIHMSPRNGHMYVASWMIVNRWSKGVKKTSITHYGPIDDPKLIANYPLKLVGHHSAVFMNKTGGMQHDVFVDFYTDPPTVWVVPGKGDTDSKLLQMRAAYSPGQYRRSPWASTHYQLYQEKGKKLVKKVDFAKDVAKAIGRVTPPQSPALDRQRLYVDPNTGYLYVAEGDCGVGKAFKKLLRIKPDTGKTKEIRMPFSTEDMAFDLSGFWYLRTDTHVARFDIRTRREVPWDYGEQRTSPGFDGDGGKLMATIPMPGTGRPGCFHLGGFHVSPKGNIIVHCYNKTKTKVTGAAMPRVNLKVGRPYSPPMYPGRLRWGEVHVWDKHGKLVYEDAVGGLPMTDGLALDKDDNIYVLAAANRVLDGKEYPLERAETLMKFKAKRGRILTASKRAPVPLPAAAAPKRPPDLAKGIAGKAWVEGSEWLYGGTGYGGFMSSKGGGGCACWTAKFDLDLYARSFVTELNRFRVAVLDTNGNLILRMGQYGNVDDGMPLVREGGPDNPRSIGGDEVVICHASYVATHSDRRLFIADYGNYRILSVKLGYHAEEKIALKGVPDQAKK